MIYSHFNLTKISFVLKHLAFINQILYIFFIALLNFLEFRQGIFGLSLYAKSLGYKKSYLNLILNSISLKFIAYSLNTCTEYN